ncbi:MAG: TSUP family transporter, partial [Verrucomicrobiales bacterium]
MIEGAGPWLWVVLAAYLVGVAKTGFGGIGIIPVAIMAELFGKASVGVLLPILVVADVSVYPIFRKYASWQPVWALLPPALVGLVLGWFLLDWVPEELARPVIGGIILVMVAFQLLRKFAPAFFQKMAASK